ncbi:MAG TPA: hypothetical protein DEB09_04850 [Candidatus Magasanikbacteria bacterium]|nr:hypothetical protein [Candidatus Magasanikbacteria bacterium]
MRQNYTLEQIKTIMNNYDLGEPINFSIFEVGIENTNILVETSTNKYVIKICESETAKVKDIELEISLMQKAFDSGLPVPKIIKTIANTNLVIFLSKPTFVMSYLEGVNVYAEQVSISFLEEVASASAKMVKCFFDLKNNNFEKREHYWNLQTFSEGKKYLVYLDKDKKVDKKLIGTIYEEWERKVAVNFSVMQTSFIHGDIAAHNLLMHDGHLSGIIDFGDASYGCIIFELAIAIAQLCMLQNDWQEAVKVYAKKFQEILPLNKIEKDILYYLVRCRSANMIVICNGLYHTEAKRKDYVWFHDQGVENLKKLEKIGKEKFDKIL